MSSLRKYKIEPKYLLNSALNLFRSKKIKTIVVEGVSDKKFLSQWEKRESPIRFDGLDGKRLVEKVYGESRSKPYIDYDFLYFFADVDYDAVAKLGLHIHPKFIYNAYCFNSENLIYNDLEIFLVNTSSLGKVLANHDISINEVDGIRERLELASRKIGAFRAADILLQKREGLTTSILNGIEVSEFFDPVKIDINVDFLKSRIPYWTSKKYLVQDLVEVAEKTNFGWPALWSLSRGHDVTEMIYLHLESKGFKGLNSSKIELMLRLACESNDYRCSPMGQKLIKADPECLLELN